MNVKKIVAIGDAKTDIFSAELPELSAHCVQVKTIYSLISSGTEVSTLLGKTASFAKPWSSSLRLFENSEKGKKSFPVQLGYSSVGRIVRTGSKVTSLKVGDIIWLDRPHQTHHVVSEVEAQDGIWGDDRNLPRATFRVLTKVALAGVHDAQPYIGSTAAVVGCGVIGNLVADLLVLAGAGRVYLVDHSDFRLGHVDRENCIRVNSSNIDAAHSIKTSYEPSGVDFAIDSSGRYSGLNTALRVVGIGGRVITISTYTDVDHKLDLGAEFHRNRLELISSMAVNGCHHRGGPRWNHARLMQTSNKLLEEGFVRPERLISHEIGFRELPELYNDLILNPSNYLGILVNYDGND